MNSSPSTSPGPVRLHVRLRPKRAWNRPGTRHTFTATVRDETGRRVAGVELEWNSSGVGGFTSTRTVTDDKGRARAVVASNGHGDEEITVRIKNCGSAPRCVARAVKHWGLRKCDILGTDGPDTIFGTAESEVICGFDGDDVIRGGGGDDTILAGGGDDAARGGAGEDLLKGQRGDDSLKGKAGDDSLRGGPDDDSLNGGRDDDDCAGGPGADTQTNCES